MARIECAEFRQFADAYLDAELDAPDRGTFDAHVASCPGCRDTLEEKVAFRRALRPHLQRPARLPDEARQRMQARLRAATRPHAGQRWARRLAVPVPALAALFLLIPQITAFAPAAPVADAAVTQHCNRLPVEIPSPKVDDVEDWFRDKIPFVLSAPRFRDNRVQLLGGRLSQMNNRMAAHLVYGVGRHKLTVLVFEAVEGETPAETVRHVNGHNLAWHAKEGYGVAVYRTGQVTYAVTSDMPEPDMMQVVASAF